MPRPITESDVRHAAKLSRLALTDAEVEHFTGQLAAVLEHISVLNELDVTDVEPLAGAIDLKDVTRPDRESSRGWTWTRRWRTPPSGRGRFLKCRKCWGR